MFFKKKEKIEKVHGEELLTCPRCNIKMEKLKKGDVIIDVCKKCEGMWLDAGEMGKLADMAQGLKQGEKIEEEKVESEKPVEENEDKNKESIKKEDDKDGKE